MKYSILINQYAAVKHGFKLDLIDLAIYDFIKDFSLSKKCFSINTPDGVFFWISHNLIIENLPLIGIKTKQGIIKRIDNLVKTGILIKHPDCDKHNKSLYAFGENCELLAFHKNDDSVDTPIRELQNPLNDSLDRPLYESLGNNNYNINNTNNINNKAENEFSALFPESVEVEKKKKLRGTSEPRMCLFVNSRFANFEDFEKCFDKPEFADVDICYYYHAVADWSASKGRMQKDWIAQTRNFIRGDREKGKLHLKSQAGNVLGMNYDEAILALKEIDEL